MAKVTWKPGTFLYPIPAVMVSCGTMEKSNIILGCACMKLNFRK